MSYRYHFSASHDTANLTRINPMSKGYGIMKKIIESDGATKYDCLIAIGKTGTRHDLRGYYSVYFQSLVNNGLLTRGPGYKYHATELGIRRFEEASQR